MKRKLVMGVFDSEKYWRDDTAALLPGIHDQSSANIINVMDELLFPFCTEGDALITAKKMQAGHKEYLHGIGFHFGNNAMDLEDPVDAGGAPNNVFQAAAMPNNHSKIKDCIDGDTYLSPYAVIPHAREMCRALSLRYALPELERVKAVNSKIYSNTLRMKLGLIGAGEVVHESGELASTGRELLKKGAFLIKDEFGVSGKGNLLITSEKMLLRIAGYLQRQEENQKTVRLLLEPFLEKQLDFSCSVVSDAEGSIHIESAQSMVNNNFNYAGTCAIGDDLYRRLEEKDYFTTVEQIAGELYRDGYFGEIGIDSMIVKDGTIVPIIEINARKTMGMINKRINLFLQQFNREGQLALSSVGYTRPVEFQHLLQDMRASNILFEPGRERGIIPLSANTLLINRPGAEVPAPGPDVFKGRFYYSAAAATEQERHDLIQKTGEFLKAEGFKVY